MELRQLRYFITVADELHFTRAAQRLGIAQPPLSQQVRRLERDLGIQLFDRNNRHVQLTDAGRAFLTEARLTVAHASRAIEVARRTREPHSGRLSIGGQTTVDVSVIPRLLPRFLRQHPDISVMLQTPLTPLEQVGMLLEDQIDVGFLRLPVRHAALAVRPIFRERLLAALPRRHPLARHRVVTLQELASSTFVMFRRSNAPGLYDAIMGAWRSAGMKPRVLEETMRTAAILSLVAAGRGISLMPRAAAGLGRPGVVFRPVRPALPTVEMGVAHRRAETSPIVRAFLDLVDSVFPRPVVRPSEP
jgi:DNA-binding transcriptional LysR family regulator